MRLVVGNKNYSSWSMRPWVLMQPGAASPSTKCMLRFDSFDARLALQDRRSRRSARPAGCRCWSTTASPSGTPGDRRVPGRDASRTASSGRATEATRARARSVCAEMHSGFGALRSHCPMNIEARLPEVGARVLARAAGGARRRQRIVQMWTELLDAHGGPDAVRRLQHRRRLLRAGVHAHQHLRLPVPATDRRYIERAVRAARRERLDRRGAGRAATSSPRTSPTASAVAR